MKPLNFTLGFYLFLFESTITRLDKNPRLLLHAKVQARVQTPEKIQLQPSIKPYQAILCLQVRR